MEGMPILRLRYLPYIYNLQRLAFEILDPLTATTTIIHRLKSTEWMGKLFKFNKPLNEIRWLTTCSEMKDRECYTVRTQGKQLSPGVIRARVSQLIKTGFEMSSSSWVTWAVGPLFFPLYPLDLETIYGNFLQLFSVQCFVYSSAFGYQTTF